VENIAIYGAGDFGQKIFEVLHRIGCVTKIPFSDKFFD
jgi:Trk K+ transport system NAD-binding subunit